MKTLKCYINDTRDKCFKVEHLEFVKRNEIDSLRVTEIKNYYVECEQRLSSCVVFEELLMLELKYELDDIKYSSINISYKECSLEPQDCYIQFSNIYEQNKNLNSQLKKYSRKINNLNSLIGQLKEFNQFNKKQGNVYFKFFKDKYDELVCTYFEKDDFNVDSNLMQIWLAYRKPSYGEASNIAITYYSGKLKIDEFGVVDKRRWHGRIILKSLLELIPHFNSKIDAYNSEVYDVLMKRYDSFDDFIKSNNSMNKYACS